MLRVRRKMLRAKALAKKAASTTLASPTPNSVSLRDCTVRVAAALA
jgi:hypothetical protein